MPYTNTASTFPLTPSVLGRVPHTPPLPACGRQARGDFESSSGRGFGHDAARPNATSTQIRPRISRISSTSRKQLRVGHVFFRFGTSGLQELIEAEELAGGAHHHRSIPKYNRRDAKEWRILVSSESITGASSLRAGIPLWQELTTPQVSMNICASG